MIQKISPGSKRLKNNIKVPMILLCWSCGVLNGCWAVFIKIGGEVINSPDLHDHVWFAILMGFLGSLCAGVNVYCLNQSMKYYQNLDVMPVYQSMILMFMLLTGLIVLNESDLYNWWQLFKLYASAGLIVLGIFVLTRKKNLVVVQDQEV